MRIKTLTGVRLVAGGQRFRIFWVDEIWRSDDGAKSFNGRVAQASACVDWLRHHRSLS
jgi:hypothetical protein